MRAEPLQFEFGVQRHDVDLAGPHDLPGIGVAQPVVGLLELPAVAIVCRKMPYS
jgi:hypothetical protein